MNDRRIRSWVMAPLALLLALAGGASLAAAPDVTAQSAHPARATIEAAFTAALAGDVDAYLATMHPDEVANETQRAQVLRYAWKRFQKQAEWYLKGKDAGSFVIEGDVEKTGEDSIRVFLKDQSHPSRMKVPVRLKKNPAGAKYAWGITANSL